MNTIRKNNGIQVRPFSSHDVESFYITVRASLDTLAYWMPWCHADYRLDDAERWIRYCESVWATGDAFPLGVFDSASGTVLGGTGIHDVSKAYHSGGLGYWVGSAHTGKGVARAAAGMAADIAFTELQMTRLEIAVLTHNTASQRVALALGARLEATARNRLYFHGKPEAALVYSLVPEDGLPG